MLYEILQNFMKYLYDSLLYLFLKTWQELHTIFLPSPLFLFYVIYVTEIY